MKFTKFNHIQKFCEAVSCHLSQQNMRDVNDDFLNKISNVMIADFNMTDVLCDLLIFADHNHVIIINKKKKDEIKINHSQFLQDIMYTDDLV